MGRWFLVSMTAALVLAVAPASALANPQDVTATGRYVQANYLLTQAANSKIKAAEAALQNISHQISGDCANLAYDSPENPDSEQLSNEVIGAVVLSAYHTDVPAGTRFVRETEGLRWSSRALTSTVQSYVGNIRVLTKLAVPDVCADVRAWVASHYQTLPTSTVRFDRQFMPNWVAIGDLPQQLAPFERPAQRAIIRRTGQFEYALTEVEANAGVETWDETMNALVLQP